jgi:hypothetical protein
VPHPEFLFQAGTCAMLADRFRTTTAAVGAPAVAADLDRAEGLAVRFLERAKASAGPAAWAKTLPGVLLDPTFRELRRRDDFRARVAGQPAPGGGQ